MLENVVRYSCVKGHNMIGETKYYLDFKNKKVSEGVVISEQITQSGYDVYLLKTDKSIEQIECCIAFANKELAEEELARKLPLAKEMESINEETKKKLDFFRERIIGKPKFKHLIGGNK